MITVHESLNEYARSVKERLFDEEGDDCLHEGYSVSVRVATGPPPCSGATDSLKRERHLSIAHAAGQPHIDAWQADDACMTLLERSTA